MWQQFQVAPANYNQITLLVLQYCYLQKRAIKGYSHSFRTTYDMRAVSLLETEQRTALYKSDQ